MTDRVGVGRLEWAELAQVSFAIAEFGLEQERVRGFEGRHHMLGLAAQQKPIPGHPPADHEQRQGQHRRGLAPIRPDQHHRGDGVQDEQ